MLGDEAWRLNVSFSRLITARSLLTVSRSRLNVASCPVGFGGTGMFLLGILQGLSELVLLAGRFTSNSLESVEVALASALLCLRRPCSGMALCPGPRPIPLLGPCTTGFSSWHRDEHRKTAEAPGAVLRGEACWEVGTEREQGPSLLKTLGDSLMKVSCRRKPLRSVSPPLEWDDCMRTSSKRLDGATLLPDNWLFCLLIALG